MTWRPLNKNLDLGEIYLNNKISIIYKIKLSGKATSNEDTISYTNPRYSSGRKIVGPFYDNQIIDTLTSLHSYDYGNLNIEYSNSWFYLGQSMKQTKVIVASDVCLPSANFIIDMGLVK